MIIFEAQYGLSGGRARNYGRTLRDGEVTFIEPLQISSESIN